MNSYQELHTAATVKVRVRGTTIEQQLLASTLPARFPHHDPEHPLYTQHWPRNTQPNLTNLGPWDIGSPFGGAEITVIPY